MITQVLQRLVHLVDGALKISALGETGGPDIERPGVGRPLLLAQYFSDPFRFDAISPSRIGTGAQKPGQFRGDSPVTGDFLMGATQRCDGFPMEFRTNQGSCQIGPASHSLWLLLCKP